MGGSGFGAWRCRVQGLGPGCAGIKKSHCPERVDARLGTAHRSEGTAGPIHLVTPVGFLSFVAQGGRRWTSSSPETVSVYSKNGNVPHGGCSRHKGSSVKGRRAAELQLERKSKPQRWSQVPSSLEASSLEKSLCLLLPRCHHQLSCKHRGRATFYRCKKSHQPFILFMEETDN